MNTLIACSACRRYIRSNEPACPFCRRDFSAAERDGNAGRASLPSPIRGRSRAAAFAMRAAVLTTLPVAMGCGADATRSRTDDTEATNNGGSGASAPGGAAANGGSNAGGGDIQLADAGPDEPTPPDGGFVPVPIYGGVFPDPLSRARV